MTVANTFVLELIFIQCQKLEVPAGEILSSPTYHQNCFCYHRHVSIQHITAVHYAIRTYDTKI